MSSIATIAAAGAALILATSGKVKSSSRSPGSHSPSGGENGILTNPKKAMGLLGLSQNDWPEMKFSIPFGAGDPNPIWPIITNNSKRLVVSYMTTSGSIVGNGARRFMTNRSGGEKYHVGIDLYGNPGDPILAMESGTITNHYHFYHGTYALFVQCNSGLVINYGEVKNKSWEEFGLSKGSKVKKGQPIARVGLMSGGSHMCHFETYMPGVTVNQRYFGGDSGAILNPTYYLLRALFNETKGRAFSSVNCTAIGTLNRPIPEKLIHVAQEDIASGETPGNAVLTELLIDDMWRPKKDFADGP